jgi:hypothetical protein
MQFLERIFTFSLLEPNTFHRVLFPETPLSQSSLNIRDQIW